MKSNTERSPRNERDPPGMNFGGDEEERNPAVTTTSIASITSSIRSSSRSMAAAAEAHKSEYEHWDEIVDTDVTPGGGCQGCSNGTETVTAFGEVVTEVFDLINEVAFPEVIDVAKEEKEEDEEDKEDNEKDTADEDDSTYKEDDDSMFNRTDEYSNSQHAREFLGFIGAVKTDSLPIISTPLAPPSLLTPNGMPLNLPMEKSLLLDILSREEIVQAPEPKDEVVAKPAPKEEDICGKEGTEARDDNDAESVTKSRSERSIRSKSPDRYSSVEGNVISEDTNSEDDSDWCEKKTEGKYTTYIENAKNKKESNTATDAAEPQGKFVMPFAAIAHKFKNGFKRTNAKGGEEQSELLTIVESSDEDAHTSEEEDAKSEHEEVRQQDKYQHVDVTERLNTTLKESNDDGLVVPEAKADNVEKSTKEIHEDDSRSETSASSFSEDHDDGDDRTYLSYAMSEDDSFFDMDENSVTYSIGGVKDSLLDDSVTNHSNSYYDEEHSDDSATRNSGSTGSSEYGESAVEEHTFSSADEWTSEGEEMERGNSKKNTEVSQHSSVYDNLYPTDSLFSFPTKDESSESLFDFSDNSNLEQDVHDKAVSGGSLEPPSSVIVGKNSIVESEDEEATSGDSRVGTRREDQEKRDQLIEENDVDFEHNHELEERDGLETEKTIDNGAHNEVDRRDNIHVSEYQIKTKQCIEAPMAPDESERISAQSNLTERKGEASNSNGSNSTFGSTQVAQQGAGKEGLIPNNTTSTTSTTSTSSTSNQDRAPRYRRQLSRVRMYNQHRQNIRKLQQKAE